MVGGVCKVIFMSNPTVVLRLGWGFDNKNKVESVQLATMVYTHLPYEVKRALPSELVWLFVWFISDVNPLAKHSSPLI